MDHRRAPRWMLTALLATAAVASEPPAGVQAAATAELAPGDTVERSLADGETHAYTVAADAGEIWLLTLEQRGIDVEIEVWDPAGRSLGTADSPLGRWDRERYLVASAAAGAYRVEVRPNAPRMAPGRYLLSRSRPGSATPGERRRLTAETAATSGARRAAEPTAADRREATAFYRRGRYFWGELGEPVEEARAIQAMAELSRRTGDLEPALDLYHQALERWRELGERGFEAEALNGLGLTHLRLRHHDQARAFLEQALAVNRELGRTVEAAGNRLDLALVAQYQGKLHQALAGYRAAEDLYRQAGHLQHEAVLLGNIGSIHSRLGNPRQSMDCFQRALELHRAAGDADREAAVLNNLGVLHRYLWQPEEALALYEQVLAIARRLGNRRREALAYNNIGYAYFQLGELDRALDYFQRALDLRHELGYRRGAAITLGNLGDVHDRRGDLEQALVYHRQALALMREIGHQRGVMAAASVVGRDLVRLGDPAAARGYFATALELLDEAADPIARAAVLHRQGEALLLLGETEEAAAALEAALQLRRALADRAGEAETLLALARTDRARDLLPQARDRLAAARRVVESLRAGVSHPDLRAAVLGSRSAAYELSIEVAMELHARQPEAGYDREALAVSERSRARSLLDLLAEAGAEVERGVDPELGRRRRELTRRLALLAGHLDRLASGTELSAEEGGEIAAELADVRSELDLVEAEMRRGDPRLAAGLREPLTAETMQGLLDDGTLLLHYALGEERSYLWAVTARSLDSFVLPPRRRIEAAARRFHQELSTVTVSRVPAVARPAGPALSEIVLGPVADRFDGGRIVVVADGALHYVPFAALPLPGARGERLVARHEVVHLPSLSTLTALPPPSSGPLTVAILADPVFDADDPRLAAAVAEEARTATSEGSDGTRSPAGAPLGRLAASHGESQAIASLLAPENVWQALDFAASRARLDQLGRYRIVHFATHGEIDSRDPRLSRLVLSRFDRRGRPQDGDLRLADVYNLDLDAELVVLSGCRTALGREIRGEGLVGLTRGFLYAGARRVMASLWRVSDQATAELMRHFYRALIADALPPPAALRAAQLAVSREARWSDPYYWAAFVVVGDWRRAVGGESSSAGETGRPAEAHSERTASENPGELRRSPQHRPSKEGKESAR